MTRFLICPGRGPVSGNPGSAADESKPNANNATDEDERNILSVINAAVSRQFGLLLLL